MRKADLLRARLATMMPALARDPDRLAMWVEKGHVTARLGPQRGFALAYDLTVLVSGFASDAAMLMFIVCDWLREHQPDLLASGAQGFAFEADILDEKTVDVQITLPLTEVVLAQGQADGRWDLSTRDEPMPMLPDDEPLGAGLTSIWVNGQQVAPLAGA